MNVSLGTFHFAGKPIISVKSSKSRRNHCKKPLFSKTLRTERSLSQQDLAKRMFVTCPTIARWESGTRLPDAVMIKRLAEVLD
ncbi:MAG: helix-turn-helix transcriptional regulator [Bacilli bacterium]|nr:helix-turn-helix transcriptional regulator [Bacilli bacterium]